MENTLTKMFIGAWIIILVSMIYTDVQISHENDRFSEYVKQRQTLDTHVKIDEPSGLTVHDQFIIPEPNANHLPCSGVEFIAKVYELSGKITAQCMEGGKLVTKTFNVK